MPEAGRAPDQSDLDMARRAYRKALEPVCRQWQLAQTELDVLLFLHNNPQYDRAADVVTRRGLQKSHVSISVGALEKRGMVEKQPDPTDKRSVRLLLTELGHQAARDGREAQGLFTRRLFDGIPAWELAQFRETIGKILENIAAFA